MGMTSQVQQFWEQFEAIADHDASSRFYEAFHFDDNETDANALGELVLLRRKRATASLL